MNKWISVNKKLPEDFKNVWIFYSGVVSLGFYDKNQKSWYVLYGYSPPKAIPATWNLSHWKEYEIPKPPRIRKNNLKKQYTSANKDKDLKQVMKDWESTISDGSYDW